MKICGQEGEGSPINSSLGISHVPFICLHLTNRHSKIQKMLLTQPREKSKARWREEGGEEGKGARKSESRHRLKGENVCGKPTGCGWHEVQLSANFPFISSLIISCVGPRHRVQVPVSTWRCVTKRGASDGSRASSLRDFIREEVHDVVMMCESWRRRRTMRSLPGNHIPTFRGAKVLKQSLALCMLCALIG